MFTRKVEQAHAKPFHNNRNGMKYNEGRNTDLYL